MPTAPAPSPRITRSKRRAAADSACQSLPLGGEGARRADEVAYNFLRIHERASRGGHWPPAFYADFQRKWGCLKKTKCPNSRTVIANQSADWCGNPPRFSNNYVRKSGILLLSGRLPHQCEHWFAMTTSIFVHFSNVTGRENPALLFYFSTTGGWSGDRWSPHPDSRCSGATGQYWRCPGKR